MKPNNDTQLRAAGEAAHTPTPWRVRKNPSNLGEFSHFIKGGDIPPGGTANDRDTVAAIVFCNDAQANAAFIVRACNAYSANQQTIAALVEALKENTRMMEMCAQLMGDGPHVGKVCFINEQIAANRSALALAKA